MATDTKHRPALRFLSMKICRKMIHHVSSMWGRIEESETAVSTNLPRSVSLGPARRGVLIIVHSYVSHSTICWNPFTEIVKDCKYCDLEPNFSQFLAPAILLMCRPTSLLFWEFEHNHLMHIRIDYNQLSLSPNTNQNTLKLLTQFVFKFHATLGALMMDSIFHVSLPWSKAEQELSI